MNFIPSLDILTLTFLNKIIIVIYRGFVIFDDSNNNFAKLPNVSTVLLIILFRAYTICIPVSFQRKCHYYYNLSQHNFHKKLIKIYPMKQYRAVEFAVHSFIFYKPKCQFRVKLFRGILLFLNSRYVLTEVSIFSPYIINSRFQRF